VTAHETSATIAAEHTSPGAPSRPRGRRVRVATGLAAALAVALALASLAYAWQRSRRPAAPPEPPPDLPRVAGTSIVFSEGFAKRAGIATAPVERASLTPVVQVVGTVTFDSEHVSAAGTRIRGFVRQVMKVEGDAVRAGEPLAEIESTELAHAQARMTAMAARKSAAERNATREADLLASNLTTAREAETARAELDAQRAMLSAAIHEVQALGGAANGRIGTYLVRAPIGGTVVERFVAAGQSVDSDLVAFRVADLDHLWIELSVFEREIGTIHVGDAVELAMAGDGGRRLRGEVAHVGEVIDPETRTADVRVKVDNARDAGGARVLRPGQSVVARIRPAALARESITVPESAITFVDGRATVFVAESETRVAVRPVELGRTDGERREIAGGPTAGQRVVSEGVFALKSELFR
jgi:cobalt-zinc-cadmium efflux system membrane fusion protein